MFNISEHVSDRIGSVLFVKKDGQYHCSETWLEAYRLIFQSKAALEYIDLDGNYSTTRVDVSAEAENHSIRVLVPAECGCDTRYLEIIYTLADGISAKEVPTELSEEIGDLSKQFDDTITGGEVTAYFTDDGVTNGYVAGNGNFVESNKGYITDYIPTNGRMYASYSTRMGAGNYYLLFYDNAKTLLKGTSLMASGSGISSYVGTIEIPSAAVYVRLSSYADTTGYITIYSEGYNQRIQNIEKGVLNGKTIAVLGDSISSVDYTLPNYWQRIAEKTGCTFENHGVSASRIAASDGAIADPFVTRYVNMSTDADAVIIMGGTNDNYSTQLGEWSSTDTSTLYGALNIMLPDLCLRYPGKPILFFAPIRTNAETMSELPPAFTNLAEKSATDALSLSYVRLAIEAKCEQYGIPYIETDRLSGINGNDTDGVYYIDNLHPSAYGVACLANVVQAELEKRFVYTVE